MKSLIDLFSLVTLLHAEDGFRPLFNSKDLTGWDGMIVAGRYTMIISPERIAFTWRWLEDEDWTPLHSQITIEFRELDAQTEMRFVQIGFPSEESRNNHEHGWCGSFDKLTSRV